MYRAFFNIFIVTNKCTINITNVYITTDSLYLMCIAYNVETCRGVDYV